MLLLIFICDMAQALYSNSLHISTNNHVYREGQWSVMQWQKL